MRTFSHPLRLDSEGQMVTIEDGSDRQAAELGGTVLATSIGERGLAPEYGMPDPTASGITQDVVVASVVRCEPDLTVAAAELVTGTTETTTVRLSVEWNLN